MKIKENLKIKIILSVVVLISVLLPQGFTIASGTVYGTSRLDTVRAYGMDTVAGTQTKLRTSQTYPYQDVVFILKKPNQQTLYLSAKTDGNGVAAMDLSDFHTRKAGEYQISALLPNKDNVSEPTIFVVQPGLFSAEKSILAVDKLLASADGRDEITITVTASDQYGNSLKGHIMQIISSRADDRIKANPSTSLSLENSKTVFKVTSNKPGLSNFSAVDMTTGSILLQRINVAFTDKTSFLSDVGGDFFEVARAATTAPALHHFDITGIPDSIQPNQSVNFTITAKSENGENVQNYSGKVHFSSEGSNGSNVTFPEDYTFKAEDLGTHQFSLGLSFKIAGSYKITVTDLNNVLIKGTKDVTVGVTSGSGVTQQTSFAKPVVESPVAGSYKQKTQTISGKAESGSTVKIYDNQVEVGSIQSGSDGKFSFQIPSLADGEHNVYVAVLDVGQNVKSASSTVKFSIDTTPPKIDNIEIDPSGTVKPGQVLKIKVTSEEKIAQAALVFNSDIAQLTAVIDQPTIYTTNLSAPATAGTYPVDVILVDVLGNEGSYKAKTQVTVGDQSGATNGDATKIQQTQVSGSNTPPSKVGGLIAYPSDKRITLIWDSANDNLAIKNYRVYYGNSAGNLERYADTKDASTTWYIPNMDNGKTYYFAVTAFDSEGIESQSKSDTVSSSPFASEVSGFLGQNAVSTINDVTLRGAALSEAIPPRSTDTGPEVLLLVSASGFLGVALQMSRKKKR